MPHLLLATQHETGHANVLTHTVQSEPIFNNWRFTIDIPPEIKKKWIKHVGLLRIHNAINAVPPRIFPQDNRHRGPNSLLRPTHGHMAPNPRSDHP